MKERSFRVEDEGRDKGKFFLLKEMSALKAEKWGYRALLAMARSGVDLPSDVAGAGMAGIAVLGIKSLAKINFEDAEPLLDDLLRCVFYMPDGKPELARAMIETDVEEWATLVKLRMEVLDLHLGFFTNGSPLTSASQMTQKSSPPVSSNIPMHPARSRGSFRPTKPV